MRVQRGLVAAQKGAGACMILSVVSMAIVPFIAAVLRVSTPLIFAALGGMCSERSGVINIALEGLMLIGAFAGAVFTLQFGSPWIGAMAAMGAGVLLAALYALVVIRWKADQIVAGTAINLLAAGIPPGGRDSTCREIDLRSFPHGPRASRNSLATTSAPRLKTSALTRCNQNAMTEDARMNRCGRFPASRCARHGRTRPPRGMPAAARTTRRHLYCRRESV